MSLGPPTGSREAELLIRGQGASLFEAENIFSLRKTEKKKKFPIFADSW